MRTDAKWIQCFIDSLQKEFWSFLFSVLFASIFQLRTVLSFLPLSPAGRSTLLPICWKRWLHCRRISFCLQPAKYCWRIPRSKDTWSKSCSAALGALSPPASTKIPSFLSSPQCTLGFSLRPKSSLQCLMWLLTWGFRRVRTSWWGQGCISQATWCRSPSFVTAFIIHHPPRFQLLPSFTSAFWSLNKPPRAYSSLFLPLNLRKLLK